MPGTANYREIAKYENTWHTKNSFQLALGMKNIVLLVATLFFCIVVAEVALIPFWQFDPRPRFDVGDYPNTPDKHFVRDAKIGWKMKPDSKFTWKLGTEKSLYEANSSGFRSSDHERGKNSKNIVLLGDSYTFGAFVNYEDTFGEIIAQANPEFFVHNFAMPGFGVDQMLMTLRHYALDSKPDLVVVGLVDSDFERSLSAYRWKEKRSKPAFKVKNGKLELKTIDDQSNPVIKFLDTHSRVYAGYKLALRQLDYYYPLGHWWPLNGAIIDEIHSICADNGIEVLFIYLPSREWKPFPMLEKYMADNNYHFINIQTLGIEQPMSLYLEKDRHFSPPGHKLVADTIENYLESHPNLVK